MYRFGEVFDITGISKMELELNEFDWLLLYTLKRYSSNLLSRNEWFVVYRYLNKDLFGSFY